MRIKINPIKYLNEFAYDNKKLDQIFMSSEEQRLQNLMMIFLFRNDDTVNHWCSELYGCSHKSYKQKTNNKYPSIDKFKSLLISTWEDAFYDNLKSDIHAIEIKEHRKVPEFNKVYLHDYLVEFNTWLSKTLSNGTIENVSIIEDEIKYLLGKFPVN